MRQGYGFLLDGDGLAIKDAGAVCTMTSWNEEMERFATFLDRDVVLGIDYQYDIEKYFQ